MNVIARFAAAGCASQKAVGMPVAEEGGHAFFDARDVARLATTRHETHARTLEKHAGKSPPEGPFPCGAARAPVGGRLALLAGSAHRAARADQRARALRVEGPVSSEHPFPGALVPYFIDDFGTRCAMAHLIESTGATDLVSRVKRTANNAFVPELAPDPALRTWLARHGLSAEEAARIQPSYCFLSYAEACVCTGGHATSVIEGEVLGVSADDDATLRVKVEAIHGESAVAVVGEELLVYGGFPEGERILAEGDPNGPGAGGSQGHAETFYGRFQIAGDTVVTGCADGAPQLTKQDAIAAMLAESCVDSLAKTDPAWTESQCGDSGCSMRSPDAGSLLTPIVTLIAAAAFARHRRRKRRARPG
jgi:MYXO-CTERM domain-containing protein